MRQLCLPGMAVERQRGRPLWGSGSPGGRSGVVGARAVGNWLAARGLEWVTQRRITVATALLVMLAVVAVVLGTAERALY